MSRVPAEVRDLAIEYLDEALEELARLTDEDHEEVRLDIRLHPAKGTLVRSVATTNPRWSLDEAEGSSR